MAYERLPDAIWMLSILQLTGSVVTETAKGKALPVGLSPTVSIARYFSRWLPESHIEAFG